MILPLLRFPRPVPVGTAIPAWAFLNVVTLDDFNATAAQLDSETNKTEITAPPSASTSSFVATSSTSIHTSAPESASPTGGPITDCVSSKKPKAGAVAGGVIGALVGVAIAATAFVVWFRRRRALMRRPPSSRYAKELPTPPTVAPLMESGRLYVSSFCFYLLIDSLIHVVES